MHTRDLRQVAGGLLHSADGHPGGLSVRFRGAGNDSLLLAGSPALLYFAPGPVREEREEALHPQPLPFKGLSPQRGAPISYKHRYHLTPY